MDLNDFDPRPAATSGVDIPLVILGKPVMGDDGKPVTFRIKGSHDPAVAAYLLRADTSASKTTDEVMAKDMKLAQVALVGWSDNFTVNGKKPKFGPDGIAAVMDNPMVRQAVLREVWNTANFISPP